MDLALGDDPFLEPLIGIEDMVEVTNEAFDDCVPNDWAQTHLAPPQD